MSSKLLTVAMSRATFLVLFCKTVLIYFVVWEFWIPNTPPTIFKALIKIFPIAALCLMVIQHCWNWVSWTLKVHRFAKGILAGLLFSAIGDTFLVWGETHFLHGLIFFAIAQCIYAVTFGYKPFKPSVLMVCTVVAVGAYLYLWPGLSGAYTYLTALYIALLLLMSWRAIARVQYFENLWTWTKIVGCLGAISFLVSDFILGVNKFRYQVPYSQHLIMGTYYSAQLGIALSVIEFKSTEHKKTE